MYARWGKGGQEAVEQTATIYQNVNEDSVKYMDGVSDEYIKIVIAVTERLPSVDSSRVLSMQESQSLMTCLQTYDLFTDKQSV
jgi:hypothetical protein